jgi:hypothetical protein
LLRTADVRDVAGNLGVSQATLYRLITTYKAVGTVEALMAGTSGRPTGLRLLDKSVELIIVKCIREIYLTPNRPALKRLTDEVHAKCAAAGYLLPDRLTIRARVLAIPERTRAMRRSDIAGVKATTPSMIASCSDCCRSATACESPDRPRSPGSTPNPLLRAVTRSSPTRARPFPRCRACL